MANGLMQLGGQPIFILPEGTLRSKGKDAQRNNIAAAIAVSDAVRTTLGPKGMDKMLVDSLGDIVITNDGATILDEMEIEHPAAKMLVEVAKTQDKEVGDGTTTAVILSGELLKKTEELLDQHIHPTVIIKGFRLAKERTIEVLKRIAIDVGIEDEKSLKDIAITAMTGKSAEKASKELAEIAVRAVKKIAETKDGKTEVDTENIKLEKKQGGSIEDTILINGILLDKEVVHSGMPKIIENAKIALISSEFEVKKTEIDSKIDIDTPERLQAFLDAEEKSLKDMVQKVVEAGANVLFCQRGIDDIPQHYLAKAGILAAGRVKESDMKALAKATQAKIINNVKELTDQDLGHAGLVYEKKIAGDEMIFVEKCRDPKAVSVLIRGGTEHMLDEVERSMTDAVKDLAAALELGKILPGGGASEITVAKEIRKYAGKFKGREQLAMNAFADAIEVVPRSLAENAGLDAIDCLVRLRAENGRESKIGLDVFTGDTKNMLAAGVIEPLKIKLQAVKSATEAVEMILRIDDMIMSHKSGGEHSSQ